MQCLCVCTWQNKPTEIELIGVHSLIGILLQQKKPRTEGWERTKERQTLLTKCHVCVGATARRLR